MKLAKIDLDLDGTQTLSSAIVQLHDYLDALYELADEGFTLAEPVSGGELILRPAN